MDIFHYLQSGDAVERQKYKIDFYQKNKKSF